ncbi:hypothetical protein [Acanthopleuribacter pedis]|uniref:Uncharacterized protein n=1 Tax=Acanthopleuribacter pedis TaxID=442870 RepID=A0A8J7U347_9BACT|nr:hypothetical protein [Acanthopleuribacter pedis]MBO1319247.1 hypothetical protein [Acanthopleuribacter pedis]
MRLWCVVFLCLMTGVGEAQTTRYYGALPFWESPLQPFMGALPLTPEEAAKRVHVAATYDGQGRLIEIQTKLGEHFKDSEGALLALYVHAVRTTVHYKENRQIHRFYNREGKRTTGWGKVWEKVYQVDDHGRPLELMFFDKAGKRIENSWGNYAYHWEHGLDGSVIETRVDQAGTLKSHRPGFEFKRIRMTFGPDGHLSLMQNLDENNQLLNAPSGAAQYRYFYGSQGLFMRWEVYDAAGKPALGPTGTAGEWYELSKNRKEIVFFGKNGAAKEHYSGAERWDMTYDANGNQLTRTLRGADKKAKVGRFGYATMRFDWDPSGLWLMGRTYLDATGKVAENGDGVARELYTRDKRGLRRETRYYDAAGNLTLNTWKKAAVERFSYDGDGTLIETEKLDAAEEPID